MQCDVCKRHTGVLEKSGWLEVQAVGGRLKIHTICQECISKLEYFLRSLGWTLS